MTGLDTARSTRRQVLRTAVNLGVGAGLMWGVGAEYASSAGTVEIEYALVRPSPDSQSLVPRTKTVPAEWYESVQSAFTIQQELRDTALSSLIGSFVIPGTLDEPAASLSIDATSERTVETVLTVAGDIKLDATIVDELPPHLEDPTHSPDPYRVTNLDEHAVPGGVECQAPGSRGTLAPGVYDPHTDRQSFLTSNHIFGDAGTKTTAHRNAPLAIQSRTERRIIGRVARGHPESDAVLVSPVDGYVPARKIARAEPSTVIGQFTQIGLADRMARDGTLQKFGAYSGHSLGEIKGVDGFTCYVGEICKSGQLKWGDEEAMRDGDSGSVNYAPDPEHPDEYVIIGGMNNARSWWPGADFVWGTAAHHLLDEYGVHF